MYLDFEDYRPDIQPIGRAISWREGVLISIIVHLLVVIVLLLAPQLFPYDAEAARARAAQLVKPPSDSTRFVFVQPRIDTPAPRAPDRADASDQDRIARAPERAPKPSDPLPVARGNTPELVESVEQQSARGQGPRPDPEEGRLSEPKNQPGSERLPESQSALQLPSPRPPLPQSGATGRMQAPGGGLGDA